MEGRRFGDRFREHFSDVERNDKDASKPVARQLNLPNHSKQHIAVCGFSLHIGSSKSSKTLLQKFVIKIGILNPYGINEQPSFNLFLSSRHHIPTNSVAPYFVDKPIHTP